MLVASYFILVGQVRRARAGQCWALCLWQVWRLGDISRESSLDGLAENCGCGGHLEATTSSEVLFPEMTFMRNDDAAYCWSCFDAQRKTCYTYQLYRLDDPLMHAKCWLQVDGISGPASQFESEIAHDEPTLCDTAAGGHTGGDEDRFVHHMSTPKM